MLPRERCGPGGVGVEVEVRRDVGAAGRRWEHPPVQDRERVNVGGRGLWGMTEDPGGMWLRR